MKILKMSKTECCGKSVLGETSDDVDMLTVNDITIDNDAQIGGNANIDNDLHVGGDTTMDGDLHVLGNTIMDGNLLVSGVLTAEDISGTGSATQAHFIATDSDDQYRTDSSTFDFKSNSLLPFFRFKNSAGLTTASTLQSGVVSTNNVLSGDITNTNLSNQFKANSSTVDIKSTLSSTPTFRFRNNADTVGSSTIQTGSIETTDSTSGTYLATGLNNQFRASSGTIDIKSTTSATPNFYFTNSAGTTVGTQVNAEKFSSGQISTGTITATGTITGQSSISGQVITGTEILATELLDGPVITGGAVTVNSVNAGAYTGGTVTVGAVTGGTVNATGVMTSGSIVTGVVGAGVITAAQVLVPDLLLSGISINPITGVSIGVSGGLGEINTFGPITTNNTVHGGYITSGNEIACQTLNCDRIQADTGNNLLAGTNTMGKIICTDSTASTTTTTGSGTFAGGVGIVGDLNVGGTITGTVSSGGGVSGTSITSTTGPNTLTGTTTSNGKIYVTDTTEATDTDGSIRTLGGLTVEKKLITDSINSITGPNTLTGTTTSGKIIVTDTTEATDTDGSIRTLGGLTVEKKLITDSLNIVTGPNTLTGTTTSGKISVTDTTEATDTDGSIRTLGGLTVEKKLIADSISSVTGPNTLTGTTTNNGLFITTDTSVSTLPTNGSVSHAGGLGVAKNIKVGGDDVWPNEFNGYNVFNGAVDAEYDPPDHANDGDDPLPTIFARGGLRADKSIMAGQGFILPYSVPLHAVRNGTPHTINDKYLDVQYNQSGGIPTDATYLYTPGSDPFGASSTFVLGVNKSQLKLPQTTVSTSPTTGAAIFAGGVGIAGDLNVGGDITGGSISYGTTTTGTLNVTNDPGTTMTVQSAEQSISTTSGSVVIDGGVGIFKNLNVGGDLNVTGTITGTVSSGGSVSGTTITSTTGPNTLAGTTTSNGKIYVTDTTEATDTDGSIRTLGGLTVEKKLIADSITNVTGPNTFNGTSTFNGNMIFTDTDESTLPSTGSVVLSGGIGVAKNIKVGGDAYPNEFSGQTLLYGQLVSFNDPVDHLNDAEDVYPSFYNIGGIRSLKRIKADDGFIMPYGKRLRTETGPTIGTNYLGVDYNLSGGVSGDGTYLYTPGSEAGAASSTFVLGVNASQLKLPQTTESTSSTTGGAIFAGGVGIAKNCNIGGAFSAIGGNTTTYVAPNTISNVGVPSGGGNFITTFDAPNLTTGKETGITVGKTTATNESAILMYGHNTTEASRYTRWGFTGGYFCEFGADGIIDIPVGLRIAGEMLYYSRGTWTPSLYGVSSLSPTSFDPSGNLDKSFFFAATDGYYTRIGNVVTAHIFYQFSYPDQEGDSYAYVFPKSQFPIPPGSTVTFSMDSWENNIAGYGNNFIIPTYIASGPDGGSPSTYPHGVYFRTIANDFIYNAPDSAVSGQIFEFNMQYFV